jgi:hypothetical protein
VTPPPHSLLPEEFPALGDIFSRQVGITVSTCLLKWPRMDTGPSTGPPSQPYVPLVSPDLQGMSGVPVVMGIAHLHGVLQVPPSLPVAKVDVAMMVGPSSLGSGGAETTSKRAGPLSFLLVSS